ncbi:MAG: hypothetical protein E7250_14455 [Paenibacillaceae bacterium]|nr:hypothetical protein [Paenibacillaceae bacterium]
MTEYINVKIMLNSQEIFLINPLINIQKNAGDHTKLKIQGVVRENSYHQLIIADTRTDVQVQLSDQPENLFWGIVTHIDIQVSVSEGKQYQELYLEARSFSSLLDKNKQYRSFQKQNASYKEIIEFIIKDYQGSNYIINPELTEKFLNRFTVQYNETDWEFLKRIASFLHVPLVASHNTKGAKFTFGVIWKTKVFEISKEDECQVEIIHSSINKSETAEDDYQGEQQYFKWKVDSTETPVFEVGDCVLYKGIRCYVKKADVAIQNHIITQVCYLYGKKGFYAPEERNKFITGLSLPGSVKEVKNNQIKVSLDIDASNENECWFLYSTFYSTFYCMPENGDRVNLYFPDNIENHAFVLNSVRTVPQKAVNESASQKTDDTSGDAGKQAGTNSVKQMQGTEGTEIDISPILEMLANPQNGKLINASVTYKENIDGASIQQQGQAENHGGNAQRGMGGTSGRAAKSAQPNYDFETLAANENTKVLCTKGGKMVILDDSNGSVSIVCNDGTFIGLAGSNITITSNNKITFYAAEDINLSAGKTLNISAKEKIQINCDQCGLEIVPEKIGIQGTDIKINE